MEQLAPAAGLAWRDVPRLATAVATASFAVLALLFFLRDRTRRDLGLYSVFALGVSAFLAASLPVSTFVPPAVLERALLALSFLLPATGYLFLARFLELPLGVPRAALLAVSGGGLLLALGAPLPSRPLDGLAGALLFALGGELLVALARRPRRSGNDTAVLFVAIASLLLAALLDALTAHGALSVGRRTSLLGPAFLVFTALVLVAVADEGRRLLVRATTDPLTGVLNRGEFLRRAEAELARAERTGGMLALAMLDLDHFKSINDRFGHPAGDRVLASAARSVAETVRGLDIVGRYGGEEFIVLLVDPAEGFVLRAVERIRGSVAALAPPRVPEPVTCSAGVALHNGLFERSSIAALTKRADGALYVAKRAGRNRTELEAARSAPPRSAAEVRYR